MKIGLFGGSFDPIHWGHILPVLDAAEELGLERVIYLPTGRPPHKPDRRLAPALKRYAMAEIALLDHQRLEVSGRELGESRPTYTVDTVRHFRDQGPDDELHLLIGSDSYGELRSWHRWAEIVELARLVVLARPEQVEAAARGAARGSATGDRGTPREHVTWVANRRLDVSSTEVRRAFARGERPPAEWVPERVVDFALKYRLYR